MLGLIAVTAGAIAITVTVIGVTIIAATGAKTFFSCVSS
jgi:hypothetical protein